MVSQHQRGRLRALAARMEQGVQCDPDKLIFDVMSSRTSER